MLNARRKMARQADAYIRTRKIKTKGKEYEQSYLFIPKLVATDTAFPFIRDEHVMVVIDMKRKRLIIEKAQ